jgi:Asp-tRNA(Asn)/Glu-tRNA(Gln) amidotransferase A subunit family amidase
MHRTFTSRYGIIAMASSLDSPGAVAHSVEDLAHLAEILSGHDEKDSTTGKLSVPKYSKELNADIKGMKIGIPKEYFVEGMEAGVNSSVMAAIKELEKLGAKPVEVSLPNTKYGSLVYAIVCPSEVASNLMRFDGIRYGHRATQFQSLDDLYRQSRSEGFGRTLVEALQNGLHVVSTDFSGPQDYLTPQNALLVNWRRADVGLNDYPHLSEPSWWADPDERSAVKQLEQAYERAKKGPNTQGQKDGAQFMHEALAFKYRPILKTYLR